MAGGRTAWPLELFSEAYGPRVDRETAGPIVRDRPLVMACGCTSRYRTWNVMGKLTQTGTGWSRFNAAENLYTPATAIAASSRA